MVLRRVSETRTIRKIPDFLNIRIIHIIVETTNAVTHLSVGHTDVAVLTPVGAPRVSHNDVDRTVFNAIANGSDSMVDSSTAVVGIKNASSVVVEHVLVGLDTNGDGLDGESLKETTTNASGNTVIISNLGHLLTAVVVALAVHGSVGIGLLGAEGAVEHAVGISGRSVASRATKTRINTINELLLRKVNEIAGLDGVGALDRANDGEGPAGTAITLILDGIDSSLLSPINGFRNVSNLCGRVIGDVLASQLVVDEATAQSGGLELFRCHIGKASETEGVGVALGVLLLNVVHVLREDLETILVLLLAVDLLTRIHISSKLGLVVGIGVQKGKGGDKKKSKEKRLHL